MITEEQFSDIIKFGREQTGVEFKGPGSRSDKPLLARVILAIIGMANRRDGGLVIIGVSEAAGKLQPTGLDVKQLGSWKHDHLADAVAAYTDPGVAFDTGERSYQGAKFVVIQVEEFVDVPILCKKSYGDVLHEGILYVRGRRKPETTPVRSIADMRDLIDLATQKSLRRYISMGAAAGIDFAKLVRPSDQQRFEEQLSDLK